MRYKIGVSIKEFRAICNILKFIKTFLPKMKDAKPADFFDPISKTDAVIKSNANGGCIFLFRNENSYPMCSIHSAALKHHLSIFEYKPYPCIVWPLIVYKNRENTHIGINQEFYLFPCSRKSKNSLPIILSMEEELRFLLGNKLYLSVISKYNKFNPRRK